MVLAESAQRRLFEAPRIETERLVLRPWRADDREAYFDILQQPAVYRHFGPEPMGMEDCWRRVMAAAGGWPLSGFGGWAVERAGDGRLLGMATLFNAWRALEPQFGREPEMGWIFSSEVHGQGMAGEACRAILNWADANLEPTPIWAIIAPANDPSIRLAERLGFVRQPDSTYHDEPITVWRRAARA